MATEQKWGRKESIIWPPRAFYYAWGATFVALVLVTVLVFLRFDFAARPAIVGFPIISRSPRIFHTVSEDIFDVGQASSKGEMRLRQRACGPRRNSTVIAEAY